MDIRTIRATDDAFSDWYDVGLAAWRVDFPNGPIWQERELRVIYEGTEHHGMKLWVASDGGRVVGAAGLGLPYRDNLTLGEPEIFVRPEDRRRGIGTALLRTIEDAAQAEGRSSLLTYIEGPTDSPATPGTLFAQHHGFTERIVEIARVQRPPFDLDTISEAEATARPFATGYELLTWRDRVPDEHVDEYARLQARLSTDAPLGELDYEGEVWDEARVRTSERREERMGRGTWTAAAVAPDKSLAGITVISLSTDGGELGMQETTLVDPAHRGHRLGLLLKVANLRSLLRDRPDVQTVWTWNADSNDHMVGINETLGYQVEGWAAGWQRDV